MPKLSLGDLSADEVIRLERLFGKPLASFSFAIEYKAAAALLLRRHNPHLGFPEILQAVGTLPLEIHRGGPAPTARSGHE